MKMDQDTLNKIIKDRTRKHTVQSFNYFWASFALQVMVYSMLSYVIVRYWYEPLITLPALLGMAAYIPFTVVMMKRFKSIGSVENNPASMSSYVATRRDILERFYQFKRRYELVLIPLATFIGTFLVFELYVPDGIWAYPKGAMITFFVSLASCIIAIQAENKRNFEEPIAKLDMIIGELREG